MEVIASLESALLEITGMDHHAAAAAGAHGELTGSFSSGLCSQSAAIAQKILIPDSAHGTNPATAAIAGYTVENIRSNEQGEIDLEAGARRR